MKHGDWTLAPLHFAKVREAMHFAQNLLRQAGQPRMAKQWVLQDFHAPPSTCPALCAAMGQVKVATRNKIPRGPLQATYGCTRSKLSPHCLWHAAVIQTWTIGRWLWPWNMVVQQSKNGLTTWRTWEKHIIIFNFLNCWQLHSSTSYIYRYYHTYIILYTYHIHIILYILYPILTVTECRSSVKTRSTQRQVFVARHAGQDSCGTHISQYFLKATSMSYRGWYPLVI